MSRILVADDEKDLRDALRRVFERDGHDVIGVADGLAAVEAARRGSPDLVVLDNRMPELSGLDALARIREFDDSVVAIMFTAYDDAVDVQRAVLELGAYGYLTKDSGVEGIRTTIQQALRSRGLLRQAPPPRTAPTREGSDFEDLVGRSSRMQEVYSLIDKIGHSDVTVLIQGESGTGKELVARAIHRRSLRSSGAYVTVDCGTLPDTLTESEIFGHEAGAFTDARRSRPGKLEMAHEGTIFLDEIANLSLSAQAKLLRVLEDKRVTRVGGNEVKEVDVRIIAATNAWLDDASREGTFREDLYHRLNVFAISLPPLRERVGDVELLVDHFAGHFAREQGLAGEVAVSPEARELLVAYAWPGNVRQLRNTMERAVLLSEGRITPRELPSEMGGGYGRRRPAASSVESPSAAAGALPAGRPPGDEPSPPLPVEVDLDATPLKEAKKQATRAVERAYILAALRRTGWNKAQAARILDLNYKTLREKVQEYELDPLRYR